MTKPRWQCGGCGAFNESRDLSAPCEKCGEDGDGLKPRKAVVWCAFEVTDPNFTEKGLADLVGYVLNSINEEAELGLQFKGCHANVAKPGEELVNPEQVMEKLVEKVKEKLEQEKA